MIWIRTEKKILDLYLHAKWMPLSPLGAKPNRHRKVPKWSDNIFFSLAKKWPGGFRIPDKSASRIQAHTLIQD